MFNLLHGQTKCRKTKVIPRSENIKELMIICPTEESCKEMEVNIYNTKIMKINMFCNSQLACNSAEIDITAQNDMEIDIHCDDNDEQELNNACKGMNIHLTNDNIHKHSMDLTITCYKESSCNDLFIDANCGTNINLTMIMYE